MTRFAKFAWSVLAFNILVILWGAYVRATGSGAGCGGHWPLCNGEVVPRLPAVETIIEYTHRLSSGVALLLVVGMFIWAFRAYPKGEIVRIGTSFSLLFIITEALVGASLVLFNLVGMNVSIARVISTAIHLVNTFLLLASITLTAWWASGGKRPRLAGRGSLVIAYGLGMFAVLLLGTTGVITALGDTLFPSGSLAQGIAQDFSPTAHFLIRLRIFHPVLAIFTVTYVISLAILSALSRNERTARRLAGLAGGLVSAQLIAGLANLALMAPVPMQIIHLLLADLVWISLVLMAADAFAQKDALQSVQAAAPVSLSLSK
jgi:heme A synthase